MSNYGGSGGSGGSGGGGGYGGGGGGGGDYGKPQAFYGPWIHGQIKNIVDQAKQRSGEVPAEQKGDVDAALQALEQALGRLGRYGK